MSFYSVIQKYHPSKRLQISSISKWIFVPFDQISYYNNLILPYLNQKEKLSLGLNDDCGEELKDDTFRDEESFQRDSRFELAKGSLIPDEKSTSNLDIKSIGLIFIETSAKPNRRPYHKQKLVFLLSAMRHFARQLGEMGFAIVYQYSELDYAECLLEIKDKYFISNMDCLEIQESEVSEPLVKFEWLRFHPNNLYLSSRTEFREIFPKGNAAKYLHETFYRKMRVKYQILVEEQEDKKGNYKPLGGKWNLDHENRSNWKKSDPIPESPVWIANDEITKEVLNLVSDRYPKSFGSLENFQWPVTRKDSLIWLEHFAKRHLENFGKYEDAISLEEPYLFHSLLSPLIHLGLLHPLEVVRRCIEEFESRMGSTKPIPLASLEGFIRQIIGWREYMRHIYQENTSLYKETNQLNYTNSLPALYWGKKSGLKCLDSTIDLIWKRAYSHHITRLMVLSNFANLMLVNPHELNHWFWIAYIDAFEWVVTPNVVGMGTYADGGICSTKPYVSSAKYIKKMGPELCKACKYKPSGLLEEDACPFNALYWDFIGRNLELYKKQGRVDFAVSRWNSFDKEKKRNISIKANQARVAFQ